jgi:hypothetical protein
MATFRCSKCGCDEDSALCNYWAARVRDIPPVCSACDPKIGRWHGQFPRLFGVFLVTPRPMDRRRETPESLVRRLRRAEAAGAPPATTPAITSEVARYFDDPVPSYKPLTG